MLKKRVVSVLALILSLLIFCANVGATVFADKSASSTDSVSDSFFISLYNDIEESYIIPNTRISIPNNSVTVLQTPSLLIDSGIVLSFTTLDGTINGITIGHEGYESYNEKEQRYFYAKLNGARLDTNENQTIIKAGDIVEWVFSNDAISENAVSFEEKSSSSASVRKRSQFWDDAAAKNLNSACDWLNRNRDNSTLYLTIFGIAGKTANTKNVNDLLNEISQKTEFSTSTEIANKILSASFCGFDASAEKYGNLTTKLSIYPNISKQGSIGSAFALIAYDSNQYDISSVSINSRKTLVDELLKYQNDDGGFSETLKAKSNNDATAFAVIALSNYRERDDVKASLEKAVEYFTDKKTSYISTSDGASKLISALNSIDIQIDDKRFIMDNLNLLEHLIQYQNDDGGFAHIFEAESTVASTEQAIIALSSIKKSGNPYRLTTLVEKYKSIEPVQQVEQKDYSNWFIIISIIASVIVVCVIILIICKIAAKKNK